MSSDGYFSELDDAALEELDALEATALDPSASSAQNMNIPTSDSDFVDLTFDIDEAELQELDTAIEDQYQKSPPPAPPSRTFTRTNTRNTVQSTLFGGVAQPQASSSSKPASTAQRSSQRTPATSISLSQNAHKSKRWDHTEFAKTGLKRGAKGKAKAIPGAVDDEDEEAIEFEQFPAPFVSIGPPPPMKLSIDLEAAQTWIYPLNKPKRDYQFNIVKHCFYDNTLVCLPTGLGKTFIAGVVMLNFYRWFPDGKIVFVAPSKPLVAQQIDACHQTCGIPGSEAAELTGEVNKPARSRAWHFKRIFYMTPQTLLNDLVNETCDARDIILLVVDEAHRGTGDYAYAQVIRYLMSKNPHFRVLALSATPGGTPDVVQNVVDALHISRIEARDENCIDIKPYLHQKDIKQHVIPMSDEINRVKKLLVKVMEPVYKSVQNFIPGHVNLETLSSYRPQACMSQLQGNQRWACGPLSRLSSLARAMGYLIEGTIGMCYSYLQELADAAEDENATSKQANKSKKLKFNPAFQAVLKELEILRANGYDSFPIHPKMELLKRLMLDHLGKRLPDPGEENGESDTRVMVFVSFREAVEEVVVALNQEKPIIRASKFIGRATDKKGNKGMTQKTQLDIIKQFKAGLYNVLVATSIGEEGLDIGEIDLIICYDAQKSSIRMLQRIGRTGRKRDGHVHVLLSESREELNFEKAKDSHKHVLKSIWKGVDYEFYGDVDRLIPTDVKPDCVEKVMEIEEYNREESHPELTTHSSRRCDSPGSKKKRKDVNRNIPPGTVSGFVTASDLIAKGARKRKKTAKAKDFDEAGEDDDTDLELAAGVSALRRSVTEKPPPRKKTKRLRKTVSSTGEEALKSSKKKGKNAAQKSLSSRSESEKDEDRGIDVDKHFSDSE